jgi:hypothetical protein
VHKRRMSCLFFLIAVTIHAETINLSGKVTNYSGKPISNAVVTLAKQGVKDTTGADGAYSITTTSVMTPIELIPHTRDIVLKNGSLEFRLPESAPVKVEIYTVEGKLLKRDLIQNASKGFYRFNIDKVFHTNLLVIRASVGQDEYTFRYIPSKGSYMVDQSKEALTKGAKLAKLSAVDDSLKVTAQGYLAATVAVSSYSTQLDIKLDSTDYHYMGNPPRPSSGRGKSLESSNLKMGLNTCKIHTSAGQDREYVLWIPKADRDLRKDYDPNHPYMLVFSMHCMGADMNMQAADSFFQMIHTSDSTKIPCIFVAPNGLASGQADHILVDDLLKLLKSQLCIDTTRIFCTGFSMGAMYTYSLSLNHQKDFRGVCAFAAANYHMWLPTNLHLPLAYFGTTGMSDGRCPYVNSDADKTGGKYCALEHAQDNGCTIPANNNIPTAKVGSLSHVSYKFEGCKAYPVVMCTFDGGHGCGPMDGKGGDWTTESWVPIESWAFMTQF